MTDDPRIMLDPAVLAGKPVVRGTRLSVEFIIGLLADRWTEADILYAYPVSKARMFRPVSLAPVTAPNITSHKEIFISLLPARGRPL